MIAVGKKGVGKGGWGVAEGGGGKEGDCVQDLS